MTQCFRSFLALALLLVFSGTVQAQTVTLTWDADSDPNLAGYRVYYGTASGFYTDNVNVNNVTTYTVGPRR